MLIFTRSLINSRTTEELMEDSDSNSAILSWPGVLMGRSAMNGIRPPTQLLTRPSLDLKQWILLLLWTAMLSHGKVLVKLFRMPHWSTIFHLDFFTTVPLDLSEAGLVEEFLDRDMQIIGMLWVQSSKLNCLYIQTKLSCFPLQIEMKFYTRRKAIIILFKILALDWIKLVHFSFIYKNRTHLDKVTE